LTINISKNGFPLKPFFSAHQDYKSIKSTVSKDVKRKIIVSCVRAVKKAKFGADIGFISNLQRLDVAMTLAKESLRVCGHFLTLKSNETWNNLINNARIRDVAYDVTSESSNDELLHLLMRSVPNV
jgi:hypothetical protein